MKGTNSAFRKINGDPYDCKIFEIPKGHISCSRNCGEQYLIYYRTIQASTYFSRTIGEE